MSAAAALLVAASRARTPSPPPDPEPGEVIFTVFVRSVPIGVERVGVARTDDGWIVTSTGQSGRPIDLNIRSFEAEYDSAVAAAASDASTACVRTGSTRSTPHSPTATATNAVRQGRRPGVTTTDTGRRSRPSSSRTSSLEPTRRWPPDSAGAARASNCRCTSRPDGRSRRWFEASDASRSRRRRAS